MLMEITSAEINTNLSSFDIPDLLDAYVTLQRSTNGGEVVRFTMEEAKQKIKTELEKRETKDLVSFMINEAM